MVRPYRKQRWCKKENLPYEIKDLHKYDSANICDTIYLILTPPRNVKIFFSFFTPNSITIAKTSP